MDPDVVQSLLKQIEEKDGSTGAHTWRVVLYTRLMVEKLGLGDEAMRRATHAAAMHDLGKLDIPVEILRKPGKLTDAEFEIIKTHPVRGYERLIALGVEDQATLDIARFHHERVDGLGYPDGLKGDAVPRSARYFAVIDTFDALTSIRPYRQDVGPGAAERAIEELHNGVGSRYCGECVIAFDQLYRAGELSWIMEYYNDTGAMKAYGAEADAAGANRSAWKQA